MRKNKNDGASKNNRAEAAEKFRRGLAAFEQAVIELERETNPKVVTEQYDEDNLDVFVSSLKRAEVPPPPAPEKNKFNIDGMVDVVVFCEHPYFLNLRLTPWQKLILKVFYAGSPGNTHLKIHDERTEDCSGCVWNYNKKFEHLYHRSLLKGEEAGKNNLMPIENSPCLMCSRFDPDVRAKRYEQRIEEAIREDQLDEINLLKARDILDMFQTEMDLLNDSEIDHKVRKQILEKFGKKFQELILVLGRRSGKSFLTSVITLYEVYRFLMMGHPQARYPIMEFDIITILNVAVSENQAKMAIFDKIRQLAESSPYFIPYIGKSTQLEMFFLTDHDKAENKRRIERNQDPMIGTIQLKSGHSSASGLVGGTMAVIIIDEMAEMAPASAEGGTDDALYDKLKPAISTFGRDGKMICISNPLGPFGKFYKLYLDSFEDPLTLMAQLSTWLSNPYIEQAYLEQQKRKDPTNYHVFYGAKFGAAGSDAWINEAYVKRAFENIGHTRRANNGQPLTRYFAHLDPAKSSDFYTLVVCHTEPMENAIGPDGKPLQRVIIDHMHVWRPKGKNQPINSDEVDKYILSLAVKFKFAQISYDQWNSQNSITKLINHGLNAVEKVFDMKYKSSIYGELYELFSDGRIVFYNQDTVYDNNGIVEDLQEVTECKKQFINLQRKFNGKSFKIEALPGLHDDFPDAVAAAAYEALKDKVYSTLPKTRTHMFRGLR